jgi:uncharacterized membrane protein
MKQTVLMAQARAALKDRWRQAVRVVLIYCAIVGVSSSIPFAGSIIVMFIGGAFTFGMANYFLTLSRGEKTNVGMLFSGFKRYGTTLAAYLLIVLFVLLWMLLLIVPGIIAGISYSLTYFILLEEPELSAYEAICKSKKMMYGYKWKYFCLGLRFIGWLLLCIILTMGIGCLWLIPYMQTSYAKFYDEVKVNY